MNRYQDAAPGARGATAVVDPAAEREEAGRLWLYGPGRQTPERVPVPTRVPSGDAGPLEAVLFDRDGTLVTDVPYNGDPSLVEPMPGALEAVAALRARGLMVGVVSNQSGVARGLLTGAQVGSVRQEVDARFGPFDVWAVCPHGPGDRCGCRKPAPGLVLAACAHLGVCPARTAVVGDIGADVGAARAAGARGVLVPTPMTRAEEVVAAREYARDLPGAVRLLLGGPGPGEGAA
ncbi:D-glycero-alpha-D-manno-heptose-1,7-bisphosphate 7-phosphatase [Streptomyces sp. NRRL F-5755]|uniref:D-glycero-alpha-D-manno-heptose-1,7-bisphosphate 7-phosphatase n=1 Tax=Streptomyces sp. NRRL F-5755 TaxID=1519475 RepID=UPI000A9F2638|nr:HAD-IIIA family hydrolase [Streptomyces sp. NRRL F-5755]